MQAQKGHFETETKWNKDISKKEVIIKQKV